MRCNLLCVDANIHAQPVVTLVVDLRPAPATLAISIWPGDFDLAADD
jgi:hypothetical protein